MSRGILAIMAGLLCALAGIRHACTLKGDAVRLTRWEYLLSHLALLLKEGTLSIPEALNAAADTSHPPDQLLRRIAAEMSAQPMLSLAEIFTHCGSCCIEQSLLTRMFSRLGQGTKVHRSLAVEQAASEMHLLAQAASAKAARDAKLWQTLGLIGGACLTILLL